VNIGTHTAASLKDINDFGSKLGILDMSIPLLVTNLVATLVIVHKAW